MPNRKRKHHHKAPVVVRDERKIDADLQNYMDQIEGDIAKFKHDACPECGGTKTARNAVKLDVPSDSNTALCKNPWHDRA